MVFLEFRRGNSGKFVNVVRKFRCWIVKEMISIGIGNIFLVVVSECDGLERVSFEEELRK